MPMGLVCPPSQGAPFSSNEDGCNSHPVPHMNKSNTWMFKEKSSTCDLLPITHSPVIGS